MMMNKAILDKAKYVVLAKAGTSRNDGTIIGWFLTLIHELKARYWLWRVNRMSEGQILKIYYELTRKEENDDYPIRKVIGSAD